ncbi:MAG: FAD-binding protein [Dehalococcoidia bacterium]|nr:FAD-binding protein [Dehalococcoidia bacterium]
MVKETKIPDTWDMEVDLVVVGSSAGGLTAACKAHELGLTTVVLEKAATLGGGTAFSGGVIWIPCNHHMVEEGIPDSREAALEHIRCSSMGRHDEEMLATYLDKGPEMLRDVEAITPLRMQAAATLPDYREHLPGGSTGGRLLAPDPLYMAQLLLDAENEHPILSKVRQSPFPLFSAVPLPTNDPRFYVAGRALIGGLLLGCIQKGIEVLDSTPARKLIVQDGRIIGLQAEREGKDFFVKADKGVLLATGGYEWNAKLNKRYMRVPDLHGITPPSNSGDGHIMGMEVGGALALMDFSLLMPTVRIPGEEIDGAPMYRIWQFNIGQPGNILVNKEGKRCCDEAFYPDIGRAFEEMDAQKLQPANLPMFWIVDQNYRDRIPVGPLTKGTDMADWLHKGDTVEELAEKLGLPPANLKETVERFNKYAAEGLDPDFHRGETGYDKRWGFWPNRKPNPALGPLEKPPFYGMQLYVGTVGNLGGLVTNTNAQVVDAEGNPIPGLYATSNAAAPMATGVAYTSGMTGGKAMIFGWLAAQHAAGVAPEAGKEVAKAPMPERRVAAVAASGQTAARSTLASTAESTSVEAIRGKGIQILNEDGSSVLDVEGIEKAGDRLRVKGKLMGSFSTNMYMDATGFYRMLRMLIGPATIAFALLSPIYWLKERKTRKQ